MIENVELRTTELTEGFPTTQFVVTLDDGQELFVPLDPANRHYQEVNAWYKQQGDKPFDFEFEEA